MGSQTALSMDCSRRNGGNEPCSQYRIRAKEERVILRAVHLFPKFPNQAVIDQLRSTYDPLFDLIEPHITLVFPFESDLSTKQVDRHLHNVTASHSSFHIKLQCITGWEEQYLFVNVKQGNDDIISLHDRLYSGILAPFLKRDITYLPHMTVGRLANRKTFEDAIKATANVVEVFETCATEIVSEIIDHDGASTIEVTVPLRGN